jgi:hypothetical protein
MDRVDQYRAALHTLVMELIEHRPFHGEVHTEAIVDASGNHYLVMHVGWQDNHRVHGCVLHVDIINDKVWIQHDGTPEGAAAALMQAGVPQEAIVLGFEHPDMRRQTAVAHG